MYKPVILLSNTAIIYILPISLCKCSFLVLNFFKNKNLLKQITKEAYYTESTLSLNELAQKLDISPNYLSQIINEKEGKNFFDFINAFRVAEFKRLIAIQKNQQYTLLALAYDCGFNSKSSFNRSFKKHTGLTPSQYATSVKK